MLGFIPIVLKILPLAIEVIPLVEELFGGEPGEKKKEAALSLIVPIVQAIEGISGKEIVDEQKLAVLAGAIIDAVVAILNMFGKLGGNPPVTDA